MTEQVGSDHHKLLAAIAAFRAGDLDSLRFAERVARTLGTMAERVQDKDLTSLVGIASEADSVLVQDAVNGWHPDVAEQRKREYDELEAYYRPRAEAAAASLAARYEQLPNQRL